MGWHPIETAPSPDVGGDFLITDGRFVYITYRNDDGSFEIIELGDRGGGQHKGITHWMPLPMPPETK